MRNAPEKYYPQIGGTWDWMTKQAEDEIGARLGTPRFHEGPNPSTNWDYTIVADRQTQTEAQAGQRPSYPVMVTDRTSGRSSILEDGRFRFRWDPGPDALAAELNFEAERARVLGRRALLGDTLLGGGAEFPEIRIPQAP
jgi:hypothetical protein